MAELDLDELRRVAEAATPGPMHLAETGSWHTNTLLREGSDWPNDDTDPVATEMSGEDAAYWVAATPDVVIALLAEVTALRQQIAAVRAVCVDRDLLMFRTASEFGPDVLAALDATGGNT